MKQLLFIVFLAASNTIFAQQKKASTLEIYAITEEMPEYPGGSQAMMKFIMRSLVIPAGLNERGCLRFQLKFIVYEDGTIHKPAFLVPSTYDKELNRAVLDVVRRMPRWKPAKQNGRPVKCYYSLPLKITLE